MLKAIAIVKDTDNASTIDKGDITVAESVIEEGFKQDKEWLNEWEVDELLKGPSEKEQCVAAIQTSPSTSRAQQWDLVQVPRDENEWRPKLESQQVPQERVNRIENIITEDDTELEAVLSMSKGLTQGDSLQEWKSE